MTMCKKGTWGGLTSLTLLLVWLLASWITHIVVCLKASSWGFLIAGALMFPVAVIHGTGSWFGFW